MQPSAGPPERLSPAVSDAIPSDPTRPVRRPLVGVAASVVAGVLLGLNADLPFVWIAAAALAAALLLLLLGTDAPSVNVHVLVVLASWMAASLAVCPPSPREIVRNIREGGEHRSLIGVVVDEPRVQEEEEGPEDLWRFQFRVEGLRHGESWLRARGILQATWRRPRGERALEYGDRWRLHGAVIPEEGEGGFPARGAACRLRVDGSGAELLDRRHVPRLLAWCQDGRRWCARALARDVEAFDQELSLLQALVLGYRGELPERVHEAFARTGTLHIVAISGSHVGIMSLILVALLKAVGLPRHRWVMGLAPLLVLYTLGTGMSPSAIRACIMGIVFSSASLAQRRPDGYSALALSAILILGVAPLQVADAGFLLSFVVVAGLMGMYPMLAGAFGAGAEADPWSLQPAAAWRRAGRWLRRKSASLFAVTVAATLASVPLTAQFFNLVSPVSLVANLLVVPLAFVILLTGCLSLMASLASQGLGSVFNHANVAFVSLLLWIVDRFNALPWGHFFVRAPGWSVVLAAYVALVGLFSARRAWRWAAALAILSAASWSLFRAFGDTRVRVDVIALGDANVAFLDLPGSRDVLMDTGREAQSRRLLDALRQRGVDRLGTLVTSRADAAAAGGVPSLLRQIPCGELWAPSYEGRSAVFLAAVADAGAHGLEVRRLAAGDRGQWPGGVEWDVVHPGRGVSAQRAADAALALRFARAGSSCLFAGAAGAIPEAAMVSRPAEMSAEAVVAGSCEDPAAFSAAWLEACGPRVVLFNPGGFEREGIRTAALQDRLASNGVEAVALRDEESRSLLFDGRF
jgi:ComEC/Rec2-related protein